MVCIHELSDKPYVHYTKTKKKIEYTALSEPFYTPTDFRSVLRDAPT